MRWVHALFTVAVFAVLGPAQAQQESVAETLFRVGRDDMKREAFAEACPKFAESQRLDPSPGTLLNLAVCEERLGLVATAWARFRGLLDTLEPTDERTRIAREHLEALEPALPRLLVRFERPPPPGVVIELDGAALGGAAQGIYVPIDPGEHRLVVSDASGPIHDERFQIALGERLERVVSPRRAVVPDLAPPPRAPARAPWKSEPSANGGSMLPLVGLVTAGAGAAALGVGTVFALQARALNERSNAGGRCNGNRCDPTGASLRTRALEKADLATVVLGAGAALGAGGLGLFFVSRQPEGRDPPRKVALSVSVGAGACVNVSGGF